MRTSLIPMMRWLVDYNLSSIFISFSSSMSRLSERFLAVGRNRWSHSRSQTACAMYELRTLYRNIQLTSKTDFTWTFRRTRLPTSGKGICLSVSLCTSTANSNPKNWAIGPYIGFLATSLLNLPFTSGKIRYTRIPGGQFRSRVRSNP